MKRLDGGSSDVKKRKYLEHYAKLNRKRLVKAKKLLAEIELRHPGKKFDIETLTSTRRGNTVLKYKIVKV